MVLLGKASAELEGVGATHKAKENRKVEGEQEQFPLLSSHGHLSPQF